MSDDYSEDVQCVSCGAWYSSDQLQVGDACERCLREQEGSECDNCHQRYIPDGFDDGICDKCALQKEDDEPKTECARCHLEFDADEVVWHAGDAFCEGCYRPDSYRNETYDL